MSVHTTESILDTLKTRLESLPLVVGEVGGEKLFQLVTYYRTSDIARAFEELYFTKDRVCIIVPVRFAHRNDRERNRLLSVREITVDLLLADRSFDKGATAALTGGARNVGVVAMAERVIDSCLTTPLDLSDGIVEPDEGAPLVVTNDQRPNDPGRQCWVQTIRIRAGLMRAAVP
jgi:hypothetical protein